MRTRALPILSLLLAALIAGCATMPKSATGPTFVPETVPPGMALVYFYRPYAFELAARPVFVSIPKAANNCYSMVNSGFMPYVTDPGKVTVAGSVSGETIDFSLSVQAGETHHFCSTALGSYSATFNVSARRAFLRSAEPP